jgi:hypothetical protein
MHDGKALQAGTSHFLGQNLLNPLEYSTQIEKESFNTYIRLHGE